MMMTNLSKTSLPPLLAEFIAFCRRKKMASFNATVDLKQTIPFDPRFPNQNQTRNCWQNYVDFHRCQKMKVTNRNLP